MKLSDQYRGSVRFALWVAKYDINGKQTASRMMPMLITLVIDSYDIMNAGQSDAIDDAYDQDILILKRIRDFIEAK